MFFLRLSLLWGFSEDVLYPDNYTMLVCLFERGYICVLHSIFFVVETKSYVFRPSNCCYCTFAFAQK